jgi:hypothetical protein
MVLSLDIINQNKIENMAGSYEIKCINKSDRTNIHERITNIGGINQDGTRWKISQIEAISSIESGKWSFYVNRPAGKVNVIVAKSAAGNKYLKTEADDSQSNNLLILPECQSF